MHKIQFARHFAIAAERADHLSLHIQFDDAIIHAVTHVNAIFLAELIPHGAAMSVHLPKNLPNSLHSRATHGARLTRRNKSV